METWKDIPGYEGKYRVSDLGRLKSSVTGRVLKLAIMPNGYLGILLGGKRKLIHTLVLEAFVGPCPIGMEACHFPDRNPSNNHLTNLRWDTPKNNQKDRLAHGTHQHGVRNPNAKLNELEVCQIRRMVSLGYGPVQVAREFNVSRSTIHRITTGRSWRI
jgi:hypothetical protein